MNRENNHRYGITWIHQFVGGRAKNLLCLSQYSLCTLMYVPYTGGRVSYRCRSEWNLP